MNIHKTLLMLFAVAGMAAAVPVGTGDEDQDTKAAPQKAVDTNTAAAKDAAKKPDTRPWWQKSSFDYPPISQILWHVDGSFAFMDAEGNSSGTTLDTNARLEARKGRFTSDFVGAVTRKRITFGFGAGSADYDERTVREQVQFDVTRKFSLIGGIEDYTNTLFFMNRRLNTYGGAGETFVNRDGLHFYVIAAVGHAAFEFDRTRMLSLGPFISRNVLGLETTSPTGGGAMAMQGFRWKFIPRHDVAFTEDATYMQYFETFLGHRWTVNIAGDVPILKKPGAQPHLSFGPAYRVKEETNAVVHALTVKPMDKTFLMGFRISF
jgi:Protein of unknown function, DUF481